LKSAFPEGPPFYKSDIYIDDGHSDAFFEKLAYNDDEPHQVPDFISAVFERLRHRFDE
jgi:hypothetical protein